MSLTISSNQTPILHQCGMFQFGYGQIWEISNSFVAVVTTIHCQSQLHWTIANVYSTTDKIKSS